MRDRLSLLRYRGMASRAIYIPLYSHVRYMRDRLSLLRYRGMASRASPPQKRTSGSDGLDGERKYKCNFEIKLRSVEEKEY